jgi:uncharacterized protein YndB with AHSA1/START domain
VTEHRDRILRIERTFQAPIGDVFDAWTSAEVMRRWLHCGPDWETPTAEVDLQIGGAIRIIMRDTDGDLHGARGEYQLIDWPHRLVFTWTFDEHPDNHQLIELEFSEHDGATTVLMINSGIATEGLEESQRTGWYGCYDELDRELSRG